MTVKSSILFSSHWIFDLDGTLTRAIYDFPSMKAELGIPDGVDILSHISSLPAHDALRLQSRLDAIETGLAELAEASPGAAALIRYLHGNGANLGIVTRNSRRVARATLCNIGLDRYFPADTIIGRDEACPKPDPEGINRLARLWDIDPASAVMVGDYVYDLQAGRAAGATTVHVDSLEQFRWQELADVCIPTLAHLMPILAGTPNQSSGPSGNDLI